jgi:hypothetical protein
MLVAVIAWRAVPWGGGAGDASEGECNKHQDQRGSRATVPKSAGLAGADPESAAHVRLSRGVRTASTP